MNENKEKQEVKKSSALALLPFLVFIGIYLGVGLTLQFQGVDMAFYQLPTPVAAIIGVVVAFIMFQGTIDEKFSVFAKGCGEENIMTMCFIYIFAGAFSSVASEMGGVDSTVALGLSVIQPQYVTAGMFIIACFLSIATGSSMGTISAIGAIAIGAANTAGLNLTIMMAAVVGGSMFGDNLSIISDTTIAATRTQGCEMRDKFRINFIIALPAAIISVIVFLIIGKPETVVALDKMDYNIVKVVPYVFVLIFALAGLNVFLTLGSGIVIAGIIGVACGDFNLLELSGHIYSGFSGMFEIFLLSMIMGGLARLVTENGGINWLLGKIEGMIRGPKSAEIGIAALTSIADIAIANNTVAIIIVGPIVRGISEKFHVDPRKSASHLDIWTCVWQGIIPYGAQILLAASLTNGALSPIDIIPNLWYPWLLAVFAMISIFVPFANGLIRKNPWNFETWKPKEIKM